MPRQMTATNPLPCGPLPIEALEPSGDGRVVGQQLARFLQRGDRFVLSSQHQEDLHPKLDEGLIEVEVVQLVGSIEGDGAVEELESDLRLRLVERVGSETVEHPWGVAQKRLGLDELLERLTDDALLIGEPSIAHDALDLAPELAGDLNRHLDHERDCSEMSPRMMPPKHRPL